MRTELTAENREPTCSPTCASRPTCGASSTSLDAADAGAAAARPVRLSRAARPGGPGRSRRGSAPCWCATAARRGRWPTCRCSTRPPSCSARTTRPPARRRPGRGRAARPSWATRGDAAVDRRGRRHGQRRDARRPVRRHRARCSASPSAPRATATWAFGHVVVDEAQELSPMMWRLLMRRCPTRSMTLVGDVAQTGSLGRRVVLGATLARTWPSRAAIETLTVNYRTPAQLMALAARRAAGVGRGRSTSRPRPARPSGRRCSPPSRTWSPRSPRPYGTSWTWSARARSACSARAALLDAVARGGRRAARRPGVGAHRRAGQGPGVRRRAAAGAGRDRRRLTARRCTTSTSRSPARPSGCTCCTPSRSARLGRQARRPAATSTARARRRSAQPVR